MKRHKWKGFRFRHFEITKREILVSVSIIAIMLLVGVIIAGKISDSQLDKNEKYNKSIKIETSDLFEYGMRTNAGNAFVYGDLQAVDAVTYPELNDSYMYVKKVKEKYTMHTRIVSHTTTVNGKSHTYYTTQVYWTWDAIGSEEKICKEVSFLGHVFESQKIKFPDYQHIDTINESGHIRYQYYGVAIKNTGTIFTALKDKTISDNTPFYQNMDIAETLKHLESNIWTLVFWIVWVILIIVLIFVFYYIDNKWLE